jgi:membrane protein DedA with SNARE-associated domain
MKQKPSLLRISIAWSLLLAFIMTTIAVLGHNFQGELADPASGALSLRTVGKVFLLWFAGTEAALILGGLLYFGARHLARRRRGR